MIKLKTILAALLCAPQVLIYAATSDQTEIDINVTHTPYVKLIGSAPGSSRFYGNNDIANWIFPSIVDLGTMGLESNVAGNCDMNFSTINNFRLLHTASNNSLTKYKVIYQNTDFSITNNPTLNIPCNTIPTTIEFSPTQIVFGNIFPALLIEAGIYQDTITVVVATQ
ncbi:MAG: hypothetical protein V3U71_06105 [Cocleimonas sp.]